jgi:CheY-like chemotaxis protein
MKKILLVDDVRLLLEIQKKFLSDSNVKILTASDGVEALEIARVERPDLIVMDKFMPNMDGITCCKAIKADPTIAHIPVVMATVADMRADRDEYLATGCSDLLCKPLEHKSFLAMVKKHIPDIERRCVRVPVGLPMKVLVNSTDFDAKSENISMSGAFALTDMNLAVNEELKLCFQLPENRVPIEVKGRVVWQRRSGAAPGFGIEFIEVVGQGISLLRKNELKEFIKSRDIGVKYS